MLLPLAEFSGDFRQSHNDIEDGAFRSGNVLPLCCRFSRPLRKKRRQSSNKHATGCRVVAAPKSPDDFAGIASGIGKAPNSRFSLTPLMATQINLRFDEPYSERIPPGVRPGIAPKRGKVDSGDTPRCSSVLLNFAVPLSNYEIGTDTPSFNIKFPFFISHMPKDFSKYI